MTDWKATQIPGYEVSDDGDVRRVTVGRNGRRPGIVKGTIWSNGYRVIEPRDADGKKMRFGVHQLVCEAFHGSAPTPSHQVGHNDGDPLNNRSNNLRWVTPRENAEDRIRHGRNLRGEDHACSKLSEEDVCEIRRLKAAGLTGQDIADIFDISRHHANKIFAGTAWRHSAAIGAAA